MSAISTDSIPASGNPAGTSGIPQSASRRASPSWLKLIQDAVEASDFGTIQIKVHAGEVVQIETTRKIRVPSSSPRSSLHPTAFAEEQQPRH